MAQYYDVYLVKFHLAVHDPDTSGTRYHTTIFVQTGEDGSGVFHQVNGDLTSSSGMQYEVEPTRKPHLSETFHSSQKMGVTPAVKYPDEWQRILGQVPPPPQQKAFNVKTMRTEPFKTKVPLVFYEPGEPRRPLIKCTEWTMQQALPALKSNGLLLEQ